MKYEQTPLDKKISYAQAYNLAMEMYSGSGCLFDGVNAEGVKKDIKRWQQFFFYELTNGYAEFLKEESEREAKERSIDTKKAQDTGKDDAEYDID